MEEVLEEGTAPVQTVPGKSDSRWRWAILGFSCMAMIGNYYCFDNPAALKSELDAYADLSESEFNMLYTVYSLPNIVLPFFGGYLCDRMGASLAFLLFTVAITCGQVVFAFGVSIKSLPLMYVGRVIFGLGGENMSVGSSVILEEWFRNKEMALAMGLNVAVSRIGSVINNIVSPAIAISSGVPAALWFGAVVCGMSVACAMLILPMDRAAARRLKGTDVGALLGGSSSPTLDSLLKEDEEPTAGQRAVSSDSQTYNPAHLASKSRQISRDASYVAETRRARSISLAPPDPEAVTGLSLKVIRRFSFSFWLLTFCCLVVYGDVIPFNNVASSLLMERDFFKPQPNSKCALTNTTECQSSSNPPNSYCKTDSDYQPPLPDFVKESKIDCTAKKWKKGCTKDYCDGEIDATSEASYIMSIPYFMSAVLSPVLGGAVDKVGGRAIICFFSAATLAVVHSLMGFTPSVTPIVPMVGQGVAYSMFAAALWPSVPYLVPDDAIGVAYGVVTAVQNAGLAGIPLMVAAVYTASNDQYIPNVEILFVVFAIIGSASALLLNFTAPQLNMRNPITFDQLEQQKNDGGDKLTLKKDEIGDYLVLDNSEQEAR